MCDTLSLSRPSGLDHSVQSQRRARGSRPTPTATFVASSDAVFTPAIVALRDAIARCDREIAEIQARPDVCAGECPAWLVALGINDWLAEKRLLEKELLRHGV